MKVGLVVTCRTTHATPAGFTAHVELREYEEEIALQQISKNVDVIFGGGRSFYTPKGSSLHLNVF